MLHPSHVFCLDVHKYNGTILAGGYDGSIQVFDPRQLRNVDNFLAHSEPVASVDYSINGIDFATSSSDGLVRVWDNRYHSCCKYTLGTSSNSPVCCARFSENGKYLLSSSLDSCHRLFSMFTKDDYEANPRLVREYRGHVNIDFSLQSCLFSSPNGQFVASGSEDNTVRIFDCYHMSMSGHTFMSGLPVERTDRSSSQGIARSCGPSLCSCGDNESIEEPAC